MKNHSTNLMTGSILMVILLLGNLIISCAGSGTRLTAEELEQQKIQRQQQHEAQVATARSNLARIVPGTSLEEVISIAGMNGKINRSMMGGIYVGMGVFPQNAGSSSTYTGDAQIDCYKIKFKEGKVVTYSLDEAAIGSQTANFRYIIGK